MTTIYKKFIHVQMHAKVCQRHKKMLKVCELNHLPTPKQTTPTLIQTWERRKGGPHTTRVSILIMWKNEEKKWCIYV
jgi:hypothetical protein